MEQENKSTPVHGLEPGAGELENGDSSSNFLEAEFSPKQKGQLNRMVTELLDSEMNLMMMKLKNTEIDRMNGMLLSMNSDIEEFK